ncbi:MAG: hypothetical protein M5U09_19805 [Gammaproteobacteria bacterium]|nr:hypothetical protein [Gammaproteobacteria bacterium]
MRVSKAGAILSCASVLALPFAASSADFPEGVTMMNAAQMKEFLPGKTFVGEVNGDTYEDTFHADGTQTGHGLGNKPYAGVKWSLVDNDNDAKDRLCVRGNSHYRKRTCFEVGLSADGRTLYYKQGRDIYPAKLKED